MPYDATGALPLAQNPFAVSGMSPLARAMVQQANQPQPDLTAADQAAMQPETFANPAVKGMIDSLASLPKRALEASAQDVQHLGEDGYQPQAVAPAVDTAMTMMGMGAPMAEAGAAGMFGGKLAQSADLGALKRAQSLDARSTSVEKIWNKTGWFKGTDGEWRFEIPDHGASLTADAAPQYGKGASLGDYLNHPAFMDAYPGLRDVRVLVDPTASTGAHYIAGFGEHGAIGLSEAKKGDLSAILHETQHAIQGKEGFSRGTSVEEAGSRENYMRNAGETEARNVQTRSDLSTAFARSSTYQPEVTANFGGQPFSGTNAQYEALAQARKSGASLEQIQQMIVNFRNSVPPWLTESIPRSEQILRMPASAASDGPGFGALAQQGQPRNGL